METGYKWFKNKLILIAGAIIIICLIGGSIYGYHQHQITVQKQNLKLEREKYIKAINKAKFDILQSAALSENMVNKYLQVWHDVIFDDKVSVDGVTYTDMDEALTAQNTSFDKSGDNDKLQKQQEKIQREMKSLNNYPKGYKQYYDMIFKYYQTYKQFSDLALNPTGSYQSFSDKTQELDDQLGSQYDELEIKLPSNDNKTKK